jgi:hypothetical protein
MSNDEAKERAKNYMSLKGALEPKQIKCYCGHTSYCDCSPLDESFGLIYVLETLLDFAGEDNATSISISTIDAVKIIKLLKQIK